jgi:TP901 family phage tail tape measure protein
VARRRIEVEIIGNPRSLGAALGKSVGMLDTFAMKMRTIGMQMHSTGRTLTRGVTLPILAVAAASTKMGLDFGESMTHIRALVGASDAQMGRYREGVLELGKVVPQGPQELADALYFVTSAGFRGEAALRVLDASARAAAAGLGDTATVADLVTSAVNVYGEKMLPAARATDVLLATVREGKAEPAELAASLGRVIAPAEAMGVTFDEIGGAVAGLTLGGLDAAEAVTGLRGILTSIIKPSDKARETLEAAGMSIGDIRRQVDRNGILPTLQKLRDRFGENKDALGRLFPNVRALNAFLSLTGRNAGKNARAMKGVTDSVGDTNKAFAEASEDATFRFRRAWSKLRVALINASDSIIPVLTAIVDKVSGLADVFQNLSPSTRKMVIGLALVAAALGPLLMMLGSLVLLIGIIASPIGVVVLALAALGAAFVVLYTKSETFRRLVGQAWAYIQTSAARVVAWYQGTLAPAIENVLTFLRFLWAQFGGFITRIVRTQLGTLIAVIRANFNIIKGVFEFFAAILRGDWSAAWAALKSIARNMLAGVVAILKGAVLTILAVVREIGSRLLALGGYFLDKGKELGWAIINGIIAAIRGAAGSIGSALRSVLPDPGGGVPFIEGIQTGVRNFHGGMALVGERGPELVNLPRGSDVYNARQTRGMLYGERSSSLLGLGVEGKIDADGYLRGVVVSELDAQGRASRRRSRMGVS